MAHDILETMQDELDEGIAYLRPHYPDKDDDELLICAMFWRPIRYEKGRWPSAEEIEEAKAKEEEDKAKSESAAAA